MKKLWMNLAAISLGFTISAHAAIYHMPAPGNDLVGQVFSITVARGDTFDKIRTKYDVSYHELIEANPKVKPSRLRVGQKLVIPTQFILPKYRHGIVINTAELRLYYFTPDNQYVFTTTVGLGRSGWRTPTTVTRVVRKEEDPIWYVPESIAEWAYETKGKILPEKIMPGPDNPLGKYAIYLAKNGYLIHGTNAPLSVGKYFSSGCMRLRADAIKFLYENVAINTPVYLIHHPDKAGWYDNELYLESHEPMSHDEEMSDLNTRDAEKAINEATQNRMARIDWNIVDSIERHKTGVPQPIGFGVTHFAEHSVNFN